MSKYKLVHVNMTESTLNKIDDVKTRTNAENKTTAIRYSIEIADMITEVISKGGKVIMEEKGEVYTIQPRRPAPDRGDRRGPRPDRGPRR